MLFSFKLLEYNNNNNNNNKGKTKHPNKTQYCTKQIYKYNTLVSVIYKYLHILGPPQGGRSHLVISCLQCLGSSLTASVGWRHGGTLPLQSVKMAYSHVFLSCVYVGGWCQSYLIMLPKIRMNYFKILCIIPNSTSCCRQEEKEGNTE